MNFQPDCPMERDGLAVCCVYGKAAGHQIAFSAKFGASSSRPIAYGNRVPPSDHSLEKLSAVLPGQMDKSFQIRHFREKVVGGFDFLLVFM